MTKKDKNSNWGNINQMYPLPSFGDAMRLDQEIYQLAAYDASAGMILMPDNQDELMRYQRGIAKRFNLFKRLLQNNEMSFSDLQRMVIARSGPFPSKKHNLTTEAAIADAVESVIKAANDPEPDFVVDDRDSLNSLIKKLLGDIYIGDSNPRNYEQPNQRTQKTQKSQIVEGSVEDFANNGMTIEGLFTKNKDTEKNNGSKNKFKNKTRKPKKE